MGKGASLVAMLASSALLPLTGHLCNQRCELQFHRQMHSCWGVAKGCYAQAGFGRPRRAAALLLTVAFEQGVPPAFKCVFTDRHIMYMCYLL